MREFNVEEQGTLKNERELTTLLAGYGEIVLIELVKAGREAEIAKAGGIRWLATFDAGREWLEDNGYHWYLDREGWV